MLVLQAEYRKTDVRPQHRPEMFGLTGSKVDSISFYQEEIKVNSIVINRLNVLNIFFDDVPDRTYHSMTAYC